VSEIGGQKLGTEFDGGESQNRQRHILGYSATDEDEEDDDDEEEEAAGGER
jgi:hypothetical protein